MIKCNHLIKEYGNGEKFYALSDVSLEIEKGEFVAITGKSGSGKTTVMNMIGLIDNPTSGSVIIEDKDTSKLNGKEQANLRNQKLGYIFQSFYLEPSYSVYKNVEMPLLVAGVSEKERRERIEAVLEKVDLKSKIKESAKNLSGGEKQRVCIARALINEPEIILADEPCGNLDSENTHVIMGILTQLNQEGKTIVLITHSKEEAEWARRIINMKDGKIIEKM